MRSRDWLSKRDVKTGPVTVPEMVSAEKVVLEQVQKETFQKERISS